jgi:hypothetical protein
VLYVKDRRIECAGSKSSPVVVSLEIHQLGANNSIHKVFAPN